MRVRACVQGRVWGLDHDSDSGGSGATRAFGGWAREVRARACLCARPCVGIGSGFRGHGVLDLEAGLEKDLFFQLVVKALVFNPVAFADNDDDEATDEEAVGEGQGADGDKAERPKKKARHRYGVHELTRPFLPFELNEKAMRAKERDDKKAIADKRAADAAEKKKHRVDLAAIAGVAEDCALRCRHQLQLTQRCRRRQLRASGIDFEAVLRVSTRLDSIDGSRNRFDRFGSLLDSIGTRCSRH